MEVQQALPFDANFRQCALLFGMRKHDDTVLL